ncbi:MAG: hypothetical protein ACJ8FT_09805 [Sphingomonas sp.]
MADVPEQIQVIPIRKAGNFDHWEMSVNNGQPGLPSAATISVNKNDTATVTITIRDAKGIQFQPYAPNATPPTSPIYIQSGMSKPTSGVDSQFLTPVISDNGHDANAQLVFPDSNGTSGTYTYGLNFVGAPSIDPIIQNGGTGLDYSVVFYSLGGFAVGVLVTLLVRPWFTRSRAARSKRQGQPPA